MGCPGGVAMSIAGLSPLERSHGVEQV
jgi:hypothetical protein